MSLSNLTPEQMAGTPAGEPTPGVTSNLVDPPSNGYLLFIVGGFGVAIMLIVAGLRFYTRVAIRKAFKLDDWSALIGILGACAYFVTCIFAVTHGKHGTHVWDMSISQARSNSFIITTYFSNWIPPVMWAFAKNTFLLMYLDIFRLLTYQRVAIYIGLAVNWAFYTAILIVIFYYTSPAPGQSWRDSILSPRYAKMQPWIIPIAAGNLVLDVYILLLPISSVWRLQMTTRKKVGVLSVFATGFASCTASSLSIYYKYRLRQNWQDFSYHNPPVLIMCLMEVCVGITASCLPSMALLVRTKGHPLSRLMAWIWGVVTRAAKYQDRDLQSSPGSRYPTPWNRTRHTYVNMVSSNTRIHGNGPKQVAGMDGIRRTYDLVQEVELQRLYSEDHLLGADRIG